MKKILSALFFAVLFCLLTACAFFNVNGDSVSSSSSSDSAYQDSVEAHKHTLVKMVAQASTCTKEGNVEFFFFVGIVKDISWMRMRRMRALTSRRV